MFAKIYSLQVSPLKLKDFCKGQNYLKKFFILETKKII